MDATKPQFDVETLWVDSILTSSVSVDWREMYGEDGDGWQSFEAPECDEHGAYGVWDSDAYAWKCPTCGEELEDEGEGPMMNYHYPLPDLDRVDGDARRAASLISDLPLCIVEWSDGSVSLALTGGGMDLSWEICEAFTRLGYLPPFRFASDPPRLAGHTPDAYLLAACKRTCDILKQWAESAVERLDTF